MAHAGEYMERHGRLTISSVSVFERLRGYHDAIRQGKPFELQLRCFEALVASCSVLPLDAAAADRAARIWAALRKRSWRSVSDILIAGIASVHGRRLVTRNSRDFKPIAALGFARLRLLDWSRPT